MTDLVPVGLAGELDVAGLFLHQTAALAAAFAAAIAGPPALAATLAGGGQRLAPGGGGGERRVFAGLGSCSLFPGWAPAPCSHYSLWVPFCLFLVCP